MTKQGEIKAEEILDELRQSGELTLHRNWRRDHILVEAVRLLARRGMVDSSSREGSLVLIERGISRNAKGTHGTLREDDNFHPCSLASNCARADPRYCLQRARIASQPFGKAIHIVTNCAPPGERSLRWR
jgi:hypothetical protein